MRSTTQRVRREDRLRTATAVATAAVATAVFPDAPTRITAALDAAPMLLLPTTCTPIPGCTCLISSSTSAEIVLGGPASVTPGALTTDCA